MVRALVWFAFALLAVGPIVGAGTAARITADELVSGALLGAGKEPAGMVEASDIFRLSPEMRSFVREHVNIGATEVFKLQQLIDAIMGRDTFGLEYDETTRTAAETFRTRRGNCLSFAVMFVALAREVEIPAEFEVVEIPPDWSMRKDVFVLNKHVNVKIDLGPAGVQVVDFNISDFKTTYEVRTISDERVVAHFFNNLGVEKMQEGDIAAAVALLRRAIRADHGRYSPAWTNLGTIYTKAGHLEYGEAAYLTALKVDRHDSVAMSNLVGVYERRGETAKAEEYRKRVQEHRMRNPYYRFRLAQDAFYERDFDTAIEHLRYAVRHHDDEDRFCFLLGMCFVMKDDEAEAKKWFARAERIATSDEQKRRYSTKIEALMSASEKVD
jgi:Flp pilus assembly protein TadD